MDAKWLAAHLDDSKVRLVEVDAEWAEGYAASHIPGAVGGDWKEVCWDPFSREFPTAHDFARRMGAAGIGNDTTIVIYGDPVPFGFYAWWVFTYCGHRDVRLLDGGKPLLDGTKVTREDMSAALSGFLTLIVMYLLTSVIVDPADNVEEFAKGSLPINLKTPFWQV